MSVIQWFKAKGPNGFGASSTAEQVTAGLDLTGKTFLVTGCNSGLGAEACRVLALRGATVVGTARTLEKARAALEPLGSGHLPLECELSQPASVRAAVAELKKRGLKFDALIANAGIMALPKLETVLGYEKQFFTNHVGHFILVTGLLDQLTEAGRVVLLSSAAHTMAPKGGIEFDNLKGEKSYSEWAAYGQSKMANLLFAKELARRFAGTKKTANAVHPGVIRTNLGRHMNPVMNAVFGLIGPLFLKTIPDGAATEVYVAAHPGAAQTSGQYFADCNPAPSRADGDDAALAKKLWDVTERIVAEVG